MAFWRDEDHSTIAAELLDVGHDIICDFLRGIGKYRGLSETACQLARARGTFNALSTPRSANLRTNLMRHANPQEILPPPRR